MLIPEAAQTGGQNSSASQIAYNLALIGAIDHGQAANVEAQHFGGSLGDQLVGIRDDQMGAACLLDNHGAGGIFVESAQDIAARDDSGKLAGMVNDEQGFVAREFRIMLRDSLGHESDLCAGRNDGEILFHGLANSGLGESVGFIILMDAQAAPRQLFRHDRTVGHEQHGNAVGNYSYQHERQHAVVVASDFEGEDDK